MEKKKKRKAPKSAWKKGQCGNPKGRPRVPESVKLLREMTLENIITVTKDLMNLSVQELDSLRGDTSQPTIVHVIASILRQAIYDGDHCRFDSVMNRLFGKVPDKVVERKEEKPVVNFTLITPKGEEKNAGNNRRKSD